MKTSQHILVVEDELHLATGIKFNLEAEGYRVTTVKDGPSGLRMVKEGQPPVDLIILDLMLPGMSGYSVCEALRDSGYSLPILILSARTLTEDRTRGFDVGANQYMTKPFDLEELISRVKNLLTTHRQLVHRQQAAARVTSYHFGNASIDFETHDVTVSGKQVRMTQLELKLLRYFLENAERVLPRQELLEQVWNMPGYANTRAPDQFIRRLRKLFEPDPANPRHFLTIRDAGYRFLPDAADNGDPGEEDAQSLTDDESLSGDQVPSDEQVSGDKQNLSDDQDEQETQSRVRS